MGHAGTATATATACISHVDVICLRSGGGSCMCCDTTNAWVHHHCDDFKAFLAVAVLVAEPNHWNTLPIVEQIIHRPSSLHSEAIPFAFASFEKLGPAYV